MAPAVVHDQSPHLLLKHTFGKWASVVPPLPQHLDFNEDAVDVLPEAPAVDPLLDIPDPVLRLLGVVVMLDREDDVGVVLLAALHLAENDIPYANLGSLLPYRVLPSTAVTAWIGWKVHASSDWTKGHIELPEDL